MRIGINIKFIALILVTTIVLSLSLSYFLVTSIENYYITQRTVSLFTQTNFIVNSIRNIYDSEALNYTLISLSNQFGYRILVVNENSLVIGDSRITQSYVGQNILLPEVQTALMGKGSYGVYNLRDYGNVIYLSSPIAREKIIIGAVLVSSSIEDIYEFTDQIISITRWITLISVIITIVIASLITTGITRRLSALSRASKLVSQGRLDAVVRVTGNDEITDLAFTFNDMVEKLDKQEQIRKEFIANVSHEIKTPLASIKALCEALVDDKTSSVEVYKDFLQDIIGEVDRLSSLTKDFLSLAKLEGVKLHLSITFFDLKEAVDETCVQMTEYAIKNGQRLLFSNTESVLILGDREKLKQVFINIIDNSIKYSEQGKDIVVALKKENNTAVVTIKDQGIGIPEDSINSIFDYFFRVDHARSRDTGGIGLGLKISKTIIDLHNGSIEVNSILNHGTTFKIMIPLDKLNQKV